MSWRERAALIIENAAGADPKKPKKAPVTEPDTLFSVFSVPPPALSDDFSETAAAINATADREGWTGQQRAEALEDAWSAPEAPTPPQARALAYGAPDVTAGLSPTIKTSQTGPACGRCINIDLELMPDYAGTNLGRQWYQWKCGKGHSIVRLGYKGADVLVASEDCGHYSPVGGVH